MTAFPNATQIPSRLPAEAWQALRVGSLIAALVVAGLLIAAPDTGLFVMWQLTIPLLPLLFMVAPGLWRNLCPLAASNQTPRVLGITRALKPPEWLKEHGYLIAISLFVLFVVLRKVGLDDSGPASALLLLGAMTGGFVGGMLLKGKSGWCSTMCPLLPVQRIYGQTPFALVGNSHCRPCVGCVKNCYDFNPRAAYLADLNDADSYWSGRRRVFVGAFPGLVLAFFTVPGDGWAMVASVLAYMAVSAASFWVLDSFVKVSSHTLTTLYGALAFCLFYWHAGPGLVDAVGGPEAAGWALRAAAIALALVWVWRTIGKEKPFLEQVARPAAAAAGAALRSLTRHRASARRRAGGRVRARGQARRRVAGADAARGRRGAGPADRGGLPDGRLRRRPGGGARRRRAPVGDLRRRALDARTARAGRQHPDGVLRARQRPGAHVAGRPRRRSSRPSAASTASPTTARSSGSSSSATASPGSRPRITCAAAIRRARSTWSPTSRTSSTTAWASPG